MIIYEDRMKIGLFKNFIPKRDTRFFLRLTGINFVITDQISTEPVYQALIEIDPYPHGVLVTIPWKDEYLVINLKLYRPFIQTALTGQLLEDSEAETP
jgi:hypothetical protein